MAGKAVEILEIKIIVGQAWPWWVGWWQARWLWVRQRRPVALVYALRFCVVANYCFFKYILLENFRQMKITKGFFKKMSIRTL